jgi:SAM-dependent methyltransferase
VTAGHPAQEWDRRYAEHERVWSATPNVTVEEICAPLAPGTALDLGAGEGRHAVWLAGRGWSVTAVDFSAVGLDKGRTGALRAGLDVEWVVADVRSWRPAPGTTYDLVLVAYLHLADDVFAQARSLLSPGGRLVVVGHAKRNLVDGVGGPSNPALLHDEAELRTAAGDLTIERLGEVIRTTPDGDAIDVALVARR